MSMQWRGGGDERKETPARFRLSLEQSTTLLGSRRGSLRSPRPSPARQEDPPPRAFTEAFTIGRSRRCDLMIPTSEETRTISKSHARIFPLMTSEEGGESSPCRVQWMLQDLNTLNGTSINGMDLLPNGTMHLHDGDEIVLSSTMRNGARLQISFADEAHKKMIVWPVEARETTSPCVSAPPTLSLWSRRPDASPPQPVHTSTTLTKRGREERRSDVTDDDNQHTAMAKSPRDRKRIRSEETEDKERFMVCPVCLDYYHHSATLSCSHTFCGCCISHWFRTSSSLSCPECRQVVKNVPVRNRALDDLVQQLVGDSDTYRAMLEKKTTTTTTSDDALDLRTHPMILSRWSPETMLAFSSFMSTQLGEQRLASCRQVGLTEAAIDGASALELRLAAQNLLIDGMTLRTYQDANDRLKIYLFYG
ncbi:hypothetical protein Poli38472_008528 [Pythium oligandrum]|uniref:E3 ubiquitin-protein ligase CHFR n=1 Tax=Pythium oligandrum TaxID=41045 RepID=A0A8K1C3R7_PYTOL|nr:hypothetical protein Poli38472_008528 [Pythium oligandrum]|eukprot:TMW55880.1 hypothetical protein Poli38472_008528 [Pythium oligandrum]